MKKKIIYSSVLTALLSASSIALAGGPEIIVEPDYFSGLYIGGIGGVHEASFDGSSTVFRPESVTLFNGGFLLPSVVLPSGTIATNDVDGGEFAGYGGVQGGFGKVFNRMFYVGIQGWGEWGEASETDNEFRNVPFSPFTGILGITTFTPAASASSTTTAKIKNDWGVAAKLGWLPGPRSMIYGKIGASWANIEVSNSVNVNASLLSNTVNGLITSSTVFNASASTSEENTKIGLLLGVGFEQFVWSNVVSINVEGDYVNYGHVSTSSANLTGSLSNTTTIGGAVLGPFVFPFTSNIQTQATADAAVTSLMAGLNFYFGSNWF